MLLKYQSQKDPTSVGGVLSVAGVRASDQLSVLLDTTVVVYLLVGGGGAAQYVDRESRSALEPVGDGAVVPILANSRVG